MTGITAIVLAAGKGTRMNSCLPKVLHKAMGKTLICHVLDAVKQAGLANVILVVGHGADEVEAALGNEYCYAIQEPQLGTGHAVQQAVPLLSDDDSAVMVLCGDTPLLTSNTISNLYNYFKQSGADCTVMTALLDNPGYYGRIIRDKNGYLDRIVEARDANADQLAVSEINSGVYCFNKKALLEVINNISNENMQGEYYLTDAISAIKQQGGLINAFICTDPVEISGVNDRCQLAAAAKVLQMRINKQLMLSGVTINDPQSVYIESGVTVGVDTVIESQVYITGESNIGSACTIGPMVKISDSKVADGCVIGPFTYLRPGTVLGRNVKAGHFVEIKKSTIGDGSKVPHLSYIGDSIIGSGVNIGCGTITCNYDGVNKHSTEIGDDVFIGSNTNFIAPVKIGNKSTVAAGSTITEDVPDKSLAIARARQKNIIGWADTNDPRYIKK